MDLLKIYIELTFFRCVTQNFSFSLPVSELFKGSDWIVTD